MPSLRSHPFRFSYGQRDDRLHEFYIPALERSVRYDRSAGFFSSAALAIAAAGIVRLIHNGGRMRLLCGAQLTKEDVEAIRRGDDLKGRVGAAMQGCLSDPKDASLRARLEALAWMVAHDRLVIRVVLPRGKDGHPLAAAEAHDYYHPKEGVFADDQGNRLGFSGSSNESIQGWQNNYETFMTHASWKRQEGDDIVEAGGPYLRVIEQRFEELWEDRNDSWIAMEIPEAARRRLLEFRPANMPERDALEEPEVDELLVPVQPQQDAAAAQRERLVFRFLREAPFLPSADRIGIETSTIKPWPHQLRVVRECTARYPENFLFCDEVGLGKTIEAGLAVRQLVISGKVKRALILVPRSVLKQWQEELYEKFVLNVPRYEDGGVFDVFDRAIQVSGTTPWKACPILLASSQLAKRRDRQAEVIDGGPWDLIIVDEAHHARRKDFLSGQYRPNRLLELLTGSDGRPGLRSQTQCLYLLTATPMQVDPVEVWDLLRVLGMGGRWGAREDNFLGFFQELRKPFENRDWPFLIGMVNDYENYPHNGRSLIRIHSENGKKLRTIFDLYATGNHTIRSLRAALFEAGITYSARQPRFTSSYLHKMLQSRAYIGEVPSGGKWHPGKHEPLVERSIFERVQALLGNKTYKKHWLTYSHKLVRCGACGLFIVGEPKVKRTRSGEERSYVYYRCTANTSEGHPRVRLTEGEMDEQVRKVFDLLRVKDEDVRVWIVAALTDLCSTNEERDRATRRELKAQISRVGEKKNQLLRMRLEEKVSPEQYDTMHAELRAQESGLLRQIEAAGREQSENADLVADTFELSQHLAAKWDAANVPERRQLLQIVALNWVLEGRTLLPSLRMPFDLLADGLLAAAAEDGRGERI